MTDEKPPTSPPPAPPESGDAASSSDDITAAPSPSAARPTSSDYAESPTSSSSDIAGAGTPLRSVPSSSDDTAGSPSPSGAPRARAGGEVPGVRTLASLGDDLRRAFDQLAAPLRDTAATTARVIQHLGKRLDAISLDVARDLGVVMRDVQSLAVAARDQAQTVARATPRATRLAQLGALLVARQRWLRLAAALAGHSTLRDDDHRDLARRAAQAGAELRGGVAKLGQLASCRPDLVGPIWATELAALQSDMPPVDAAEIRARIEAELGKPIAELFAAFDDAPLAVASLAQVHTGRLHDGTPVAIKVQIPGIEAIIEADIAALRTVAGALRDVPGLDLPIIVDELARALTAELDYVAEAATLRTFPTDAVIPRPIAEASSARVLTMTRLDGERLSAALEVMPAADRDRLLGAMVDEFAAQILVRGQVHADPHPGNFLVTPDGKLALLDFGCVLALDRAERAAYARLVLAIAAGDDTAAARELAGLGFTAADPAQLTALAASLIGAMRPGASVRELDWEAGFAEQLARARQLGGLVIPRSFVLLGRVLAALAGLLARYRPAISLHAVLARHLAAATA